MTYSMGGLFSSQKEKDLQNELAECKKSLVLSKKENTRVKGINTSMTLQLNEIHKNKPKTGGKRTQKYRRRK